MDNKKIIDSFIELVDDKVMNKIELMSILEQSFKDVLLKVYGSTENFDIILNPDKGDIEIWRNREIVEDDNVSDDNTQVSLSDALNVEPDFEVGEDLTENINIIDFGRKDIILLRQLFSHKVKDHINNDLFNYFNSIKDTIISPVVHLIKYKYVVLLDEDSNEIILPKESQIKGEFYRVGDILSGVLESVEITNNRLSVIMSRTSPKFLEHLLRMEIPEIEDGLIEIKDIHRIPGVKSKVSVDSYDNRIDPVGSCVGLNGSRINRVVRDLNNENIDVIHYTDNKQLYISRCLNLKSYVSMELNDENNTVDIVIDPSLMSLCIGKYGSNIKLASMMTGYEINLLSDGEEEDINLKEFSDEIESWVIDEFLKVGLNTAKSVISYTIKELEDKTDLEEETIVELVNLIKEEFN